MNDLVLNNGDAVSRSMMELNGPISAATEHEDPQNEGWSLYRFM